MKDGLWALLSGILIVAILFVLVMKKDQNGNSPVTGAISAVGSALSNAISLALNGTNG